MGFLQELTTVRRFCLTVKTFSNPFLFSKESWENFPVSPNGEGKDNNGFHKSEMEVIVRQTKKVGVHTLVTMNHLR